MKLIVKSIMPLLFVSVACTSTESSNKEMVTLLTETARKVNVPGNPFHSEARIHYYDSLIAHTANPFQVYELKNALGMALLEQGEETKAIAVYEELLQTAQQNNKYDLYQVARRLALSYLRLGEKVNCLKNHTSESCIYPISLAGVYTERHGSEKAIALYENILQTNPGDLESRWLLNIAYMTVGGYPQKVPKEYLIEAMPNEASGFKPFIDIAAHTGLDKKSMSGGSIIDDFNNDEHPDVVMSSWGLEERMFFFKNNGNGSFSDVSEPSGLSQLTGGLHIMQTDYNNDGFKDIFVLRGAWKREYGNEPNSLLKNNGDGSFTDVTRESGLLSFHPTQTATWADFDNDGWLDVFIGNETFSDEVQHRCELYMNNRNGTFTNIAKEVKTDILAYVKGVTSGDYNNDGWTDIFLSTLNGKKILLKNEGMRNGKPSFRNVSEEAGLSTNLNPTFPTWFWDYDNDGWLDILVCGYEFRNSLAVYAAAEALQTKKDKLGEVYLFRNKGDGSFMEVTEKLGLNKVAYAMGSNFGDIDNDGYLDIFLGTGNPQYESLVPNKLFLNMRGERFLDVTSVSRVGNLQKGHGVSFADIDYDGDQDIFIKMGGAFAGDAYQNSLFMNPGQNNNHWIALSLEGTKSNRAAIGAKIKVTFREKGVQRSVYRDVNAGGSFGSNPLKQHIGIGSAVMIDQLEIKWPGSNGVQVFNNIHAGQHIQIKEGSSAAGSSFVKAVHFAHSRKDLIDCPPL